MTFNRSALGRLLTIGFVVASSALLHASIKLEKSDKFLDQFTISFEPMSGDRQKLVLAWEDWQAWMEKQNAGEPKVPARVPGDRAGSGGLSVIEDAPGSYASLRLGAGIEHMAVTRVGFAGQDHVHQRRMVVTVRCSDLELYLVARHHGAVTGVIADE